MAASSSRPMTPALSDRKRLSDAVYELYTPVTGPTTLEIIFFHGLSWGDWEDAFIQTWMQRDNSACWLDTWLVQDFPQARILSVSYDSSIQTSASRGRMDMYGTGEFLARSLIECGEVGQNCPVVLVGHCLGGVVMKEICLRASAMSGIGGYMNFLRNVRGLFFYGVAQSGSRMCLESSRKRKSPLLESMELLSAGAARVNEDFTKLRNQYEWKTCGVLEANESQLSSGAGVLSRLSKIRVLIQGIPFWRSSQLVEEASARLDMDTFCMIPGVDHFTICKPEYKTSDSFQHLVKFVKSICQDEESRKAALLYHLELPVGIIEFGDRIRDFMKALKLREAGSKQILLAGMGGLGKSTLAKQVLMKIQIQFDYVCFVEIPQQTPSRKDFWKLVVGNLYEGSGKQVSIRVQDEWEILKLLQGRKVLLMLDDCDDATDMMNYLNGLSYGEGSRLVLISRIQKDRSGFVEHVLPFLSHDDALTLFKARVQSPGLEAIPKELVKQIVETCEGLPLTLDVIGSSLRGRNDEKIWESTLGRLRDAGCIDGSKQDRLWGKLRVSFDSLGKEEQAIFLDLASFDMVHRQYDMTVFESAWEDSRWGRSIQLSLSNLVQRSLIQIRQRPLIQIRIGERPSSYHVAYIHRQLRDLGKRISRQPEENVESWRGVCQVRDVEDIMAKYKGTTTNDKLQVLSMGISDSVAVNVTRAPNLDKKNSSCFDGRLSKLERLRLLRISDLNLIDSHHALRFPWPLSLLHMNNCSKEEVKDSWLQEACWPIREQDVQGLHRLAVLIFDHCSCVILPSNIHEWVHLKVMMIHATDLTRLPGNFGLLPCLERLDLQDVQLAELPPSTWELASLRHLRLVDCLNFKSWPQKPIDVSNELNSLTTLHLENLPALSGLPDGFGAFASLTKLTMENLPGLRELPDSFGATSSLTELIMRNLPALRELPDSFGAMSSLTILAMEKLPALRELSDSFGAMSSLTILTMKDLCALRELPDSFGAMSSLTKLTMHHLCALRELPDSFGAMSSLTELTIEHLCALRELPNSFGAMSSLTKLTIEHLPALRELPDSFGAMSSLQRLKLSNCDALKRLHDPFCDLRRLKTLQIYSCKRLESLGESFCGMRALENLWLLKLPALEMLPHTIGQLASLAVVSLRSCHKLTMLPESFGELESLRKISVDECDSLVHLWEDPKLGEYGSSGEPRNTLINLQKLSVSNCPRFQALSQSLGQLPCLDDLDLRGCETFKCSPSGLGQLKRLKRLTIGGAVVPEDTKRKHGQTENLEPQSVGDDDESPGGTDLFPAKLGWVSGSTFEFLGDLTSLEHLEVADCSSVVKSSECLSQLMVLRTLELRKCINIPESIGLLKALTKLSVEGTFTSLPTGMWELKSLGILTLRGGRFKELPVSLGLLAALRDLTLGQCDYLTHLPDSLGQLTNLRLLTISSCKSLEKLPESLGELASLHWLNIGGCVSLKTIPHSLGQLTSLGRLIIDGCLSLVNDQTNTNSRGQLKSLKEFTVEGCVSLHSLPDFLFDLISLRDLVIGGCMFLDIIPGSLGQLKSLILLEIRRSLSINLVVDPLQYSSLKVLIIEDCVSVNILPDPIGQLSFLEALEISGCVSIRDFPDLLQVTTLKYLRIEGCPSLVVLPNSIGQLASLEQFTIKKCVSLISIPDPLHLVSLQYLFIVGCTSLRGMPNSMGQLKSLTRLVIKDCTTIRSLPDSLGQLASLEVLNAKGCISLKNLPTSLGQLRLLKTLSLSGCFEYLPEWLGRFVALTDLEVRHCPRLKYLPESLGQLTELRCLKIVKCAALENLPDSLGQLAYLRVLNTMGCTSIKNLPTSMGQLRLLHTLTLSGCFEDLPEWLGQFVGLNYLGLQHCDRLRYVPESLGQLIALRHLEIVECKALENLPPSLGQLTSLKGRSVKECVSLKTIPDNLEELNSLKSLVIKRSVPESVNKVPECLGQRACSELGPLASVPTILRQLTCVENLTLMGENFAHLPDWLWQMPALTDLKIQQCDHLSQMPDVGSLGQVIALKHLSIIECKALKNLPESMGNIAALETLVIKGCISLENIPESLGQLAHLTRLHIEGCVGVKIIPDSLRQLHDLKYVYVDAYLAIQITSIVQVRSLESVTVAGEYSEDLLGALKLAQFPALNLLRLLRSDYFMHLPDLLRSTSLDDLFIGDVLFMDHHDPHDGVFSESARLARKAEKARKKLGPRQYLEIHDDSDRRQSIYYPESVEQLMSLIYVHVTGRTSLRLLESLWSRLIAVEDNYLMK